MALTRRAMPISLCFGRTAVRTDAGRVRRRNEDAHLVMSTLLAVADGMGGCADGQVASRVALEALHWEYQTGRAADLSGLEDAICEADQSVRLARRLHEDSDMGTTLTCCLLEEERLLVGHVGDSRAYLLRPDEGMLRLTGDDTPVQGLVERGVLSENEARRHPLGHSLVQAVGYGPLSPQVAALPAEAGDLVMLCSDGLSDLLPTADLVATLASQPEPARAADGLIESALETGAPDNVTVVIGRVEERPG
jgi:serine/threonine protein phosphatase PrpC